MIPPVPFDFDALSDLLDRAARARRLSLSTTDEQTSRVLDELAAEIEEQINRMAVDIVAGTEQSNSPCQ